MTIFTQYDTRWQVCEELSESLKDNKVNIMVIDREIHLFIKSQEISKNFLEKLPHPNAHLGRVFLKKSSDFNTHLGFSVNDH